jgi:hypothetical protein
MTEEQQEEFAVEYASDFKDMLKRIEERMAARPWWKKVWHRLLYLFVERLWHAYLSPCAIKWRITRFCQRRLRGFDDSELWSLDVEIMKFAAPRIRRLQEVAHGFPASLQGDFEKFLELPEEAQQTINDLAAQEWHAILGKMARAMELYIEHGDLFLSEDEEGNYVQDPKLEAEFKEGWALFQEYFFALWD